MKTKTFSTAFAIAALSISAQAGHADDTADTLVETETALEWVLEEPELIAVDGSDPGSSADYFAAIQKLTLQPQPTVKMILTCQTIREDEELRDTRLNIGFDLNTEKNPPNSVRNLRRVVAHVTIGDKKKSYPHRWNVATDIIAPMDRVLARRIFNAGVRSDELKVVVSGETYIDVKLPEMNDAFRTFARGCPALKQGQK